MVKNEKIKKSIAFTLVFVIMILVIRNLFELSLILSIIVALLLAVLISIIEKYMPKKENHFKKEDLEKLDSEEIRKRLEENEQFDEVGRKILEKRKDYTTKEKLSECFENILSFSIPVLFFGLLFMGALGAMYDIPKEDFMINATRDVAMASNITLNTFFDIGYESKNPQVYVFLFYLAVFMAFFYPVIVLIYRLIRKKSNLKREQSSITDGRQSIHNVQSSEEGSARDTENSGAKRNL